MLMNSVDVAREEKQEDNIVAAAVRTAQQIIMPTFEEKVRE